MVLDLSLVSVVLDVDAEADLGAGDQLQVSLSSLCSEPELSVRSKVSSLEVSSKAEEPYLGLAAHSSRGSDFSALLMSLCYAMLLLMLWEARWNINVSVGFYGMAMYM